MSNSKGNEKVSSKSSKVKGKKVKFFDWLFYGKGTVSEPWPTAEELWDNPKVQKAIENYNNLVRSKNGS